MISTIKIDGKLDDADWKNAPALTGYSELRPVPGRKEFENSKTEKRHRFPNLIFPFRRICLLGVLSSAYRYHLGNLFIRSTRDDLLGTSTGSSSCRDAHV